MKKKIFLHLVFFLLYQSVSLNAQIFVDGQNLNDMDIRYVEIILSRRAMTQEVQVMFDYGQQIDYSREFDQLIQDGRKQIIRFKSIVHALNMMDKNGWEFIHTYMAHTNNFERFHYLFQRKKEQPENDNK